MPTIGQLKFLFAVFDVDFAFAAFERDDFVPLGFFRERDAFVLAFRFAMGLLDLSWVSYLIQASIPVAAADLNNSKLNAH